MYFFIIVLLGHQLGNALTLIGHCMLFENKVSLVPWNQWSSILLLPHEAATETRDRMGAHVI